MGALLRTEDVVRNFGSGRNTVYVLKKVCIDVEPNTLTILRGRSGSGKTTLLNIVGALDYPTEGKVFLSGADITKMSSAKRDELRKANIGFIFQSVALISLMSAYENVEFGLRIAGFSKAMLERKVRDGLLSPESVDLAGSNARLRKNRAEEVLSLVGLTRRMYHRPAELSGGEQQRVAIARAISHKPLIVFADEPTAALDTYMGLQVVKLFKTLVEKEGLTVVMTSHDPSMIEIADHVITIEDGEIVAAT